MLRASYKIRTFQHTHRLPRLAATQLHSIVIYTVASLFQKDTRAQI